MRWDVIDGLPQGEIIEHAAREWPHLPRIHSSTWRSWRDCDDYTQIRNLVTGEQAERERLSDLFAAAGGADALADVSNAAAYALAAKAMAIAEDAADVREVRSLMQTVRDARDVAAAQLQDRYEEQLEAVEQEHAAEVAVLRQRIAELEAALIDRQGNKDVDAGRVADELDTLLGLRKKEKTDSGSQEKQ